jgi:hypothetical protein
MSLEAEQISRQHSGAAYIVTRNVTDEECPWLPFNLTEGEIYEPSNRYHYGVCTPNGVMVQPSTEWLLEHPGYHPTFAFEVPRDAVRIVGVD